MDQTTTDTALALAAGPILAVLFLGFLFFRFFSRGDFLIIS